VRITSPPVAVYLLGHVAEQCAHLRRRGQRGRDRQQWCERFGERRVGLGLAFERQRRQHIAGVHIEGFEAGAFGQVIDPADPAGVGRLVQR
jgi:hypothetical protein